ncbi:uncharacterized protein N7482_001282 [Penicillium canariense]|uniref:AMP-dependent synthetase/ligase domain-containing protein n=1 Tax=Penicillium canariense TaxID=189055 RepID=A0A9W9IGA6_9EURO|nr:uncharacterized protein N7482_001282 [Penicillium canariense]KAJ5175405.1 hypothetical protein N7482_001282 [Penicillium canariense]
MPGVISPGEFPNEPIFVQLLKVSGEVSHVIVQDPQTDIQANYGQFLADLLQTRKGLRESIPESILDRNSLLRDDKPYIFLLTDGNYNFVVGAFSILSVGGAFVPLSTKVLPEEALHFSRQCKSAVILTSREYLPLAREVQRYATAQGIEWTVVEICIKASPSLDLSASPLRIDESATIPPRRPGMVLFTSGTSGPPKGVVHSRSIFYEAHTRSSPSQVSLSHRHHLWIGGAMPMIRLPLAGARLEVINPDAGVLWERLREGGVTILTGTPRLWSQMMEYFQTRLQSLPLSELEVYISGARELRVAHVGGGIPHRSLLRFWRENLRRPLTVEYGATELGGLGLKCTPNTPIDIERCIGRPHPKIAVRLSDGNHGELQIKSANLFSHYLGDEAATKAAFTEDGYYKTGDVAHVVGDDYVFDGRLSTEFTKFRGWQISILEVELRLLELPFIREGCILGAPDPNNGTRLAALVRFTRPNTISVCACTNELQPSLRSLRESLAVDLPVYMLPTALRVLGDEEEIPRTASHKVIRSKAIEQYFQLTDSGEIVESAELWDLDTNESLGPRKIWDWGGL